MSDEKTTSEKAEKFALECGGPPFRQPVSKFIMPTNEVQSKPRSECEGILPEYYKLLDNAYKVSENEDMYDVNSDDPNDVADFAKVCAESKEAQIKLIGHVITHFKELLRLLNG